MGLEIRPCDFQTARAFASEYHRHNKPPAGHKFSISCYDGERLCGVAIVGRPVGRYFDDGLTLEVNRCCTDGTKNACSILYAHAWRAAKALGYKRLVTYTRESEPRVLSATDAPAGHIGPANDTYKRKLSWMK